MNSSGSVIFWVPTILCFIKTTNCFILKIKDVSREKKDKQKNVVVNGVLEFSIFASGCSYPKIITKAKKQAMPKNNENSASVNLDFLLDWLNFVPHCGQKLAFGGKLLPQD